MGRGRGRGGGPRRGGGGFNNHRGSSSKARPPMSRQESSHLRQFGEKHPAEEAQGDFNPNKKFKGDQSQGQSSGQERYSTSNRRNEEEASESESEEESTPYSELLGILTGQKRKKEIQVGSESEDEGEEVEEPGQHLETNESSGDEKEEDEDSTSDSEAETPEDEEVVQEDSDKVKESGSSSGEEEEEEGQGEGLAEETVIEEAELDPEEDGSKAFASVDPFLLHFEREMSTQLQGLVSKDKPYTKQKPCEWPTLGKFNYYGLSKVGSEEEESTTLSNPNQLHIDLSAPKEARTVEIPEPPSADSAGLQSSDSSVLSALFIKSQLQETIPIANKATLDRVSCSGPLTKLQAELLSLTSQYYDIYYPERSFENADEIRLAFCIHAANHVLKTRTRIIHHNARMAEKTEVPEEFRDQGFVRPKILILTPFKESARRIVNTLTSLLLPKDGTIQNKKRFLGEYGGETLFMPKTNPKPEDYMATFAGNVDDNFKIGLATTKKAIKLYTGFYSSDIIVASPLGLRLLVGAEGEKTRDYDFLSSIEITILDQADVFLMQNWDHVLHLVKHLHLRPLTTHGTDFARIRPWALDSLANHYCQTLLFTSVPCPEHNALFSRYFKNYGGLVKISNPVGKGSISQITLQLPQVFQQFDCSSIQEASDARFKYFVEKVLPNFSGRLMSHTLIFVSSYFDFVRLRNYFKREKTSFVQICEYTKDKKVARARDLFFHGQAQFILYTERAHFFRRFRLKGIGHVIFYQLPPYSHFYSEICSLLQEEYQIRRVRQRKNPSVNVIYCKYDAARLAGVVGTARANHMLASDKATHAFVNNSE